MHNAANKAVILARGLGTRLRAVDSSSVLSAEQERVAAVGLKTLIPLADGSTLLDLIIGQLKKAGFEQICMVIGPEHEAIRAHCAENGLDVRFAIQANPLGTADAVLAAREVVDRDELFAVINSDNLYPLNALIKLREARRPALLAFENSALVANSNIAPERIAKFATVETNELGDLARIVEKPKNVDRELLVSMNAWILSPLIFNACEAISPSERGELELTAAVQHAIDYLGEKFQAIRIAAGVLDLSSRGDVAGLQGRLSKFNSEN